MGVHEQTITNWEGNESQPALRYVPAILRFLGYNPSKDNGSFPERLVEARRALGLSRRKMAQKLDIDPATVQGWESGQQRPTDRRLEEVTNIIESLLCE